VKLEWTEAPSALTLVWGPVEASSEIQLTAVVVANTFYRGHRLTSKDCDKKTINAC